MLLNIFSGLTLMIAMALLPKPTNDLVAADKAPIRWAIQKSSTLKVSGKSNVNVFTCEIPGYYEPDTIFVADDNSGKAVRLNGCLEIDVFRFDCHSKMLTSDLRKTLKAEDHPILIIRFLSLDKAPSFQTTSQCMKGWVEVELAGVKRPFQIAYEFVKNGSGFLLNGNREFCFSDFKLTPPRKLGGVIQVKDEFHVNFQLKLDPVK